jgi:ubiquinone/menaquinone biosynthesis C-methylase UbiE
MVENIGAAQHKHNVSAGAFYDRIAGLYNITFKFNGYGRSLEHYLRDHPLPISAGAKILDAGCGTGLLTLALLKALDLPVKIVAIDLSAPSLATAKRVIAEETLRASDVGLTQANVLALPFADNSFDVIVTSGVLEYVPLEEGFGELARVLAPGGHLLHLPVRPSLASRFLEVMFRFKAHPPQEVEEHTNRHFRVVKHYRFPPLHPIGWTKTAVLAQKV